jgi:AbrB family looped-hinge helix DNA binding protein
VSEVAVVTSTVKGQIVIPADIRKKFNIKRGSRVNVYDEGNRIIVEPLPDDPIQEGRGMLKTQGRILKALVADRKKEAKQ